jgi:hypothetical protein
MVEPDRLDWVRGALCAFSYQSRTAARPVHIHRLNWYAARSAPGLDVQRTLTVLERIREVQRLDHGYWIPTPTRSVSAGATVILVSTLPTRELQRRWGDVVLSGDGACRTASRQLPEIPCESFRSWLGAPADTSEWTRAQYRNAAQALQPAEFNPAEFEVLQLNHSRTDIVWTSGARVLEVLGHEALLLCRPHAEERRAEIFLARHRDHRLTDEASVRAGHRRRLLWGTALRLGLSMRPVVHTDASFARFALPQRLPPEEERLISAFGRMTYRSSAAFQYSVSRGALSITKAVLGQLGILL